MRHKAILFVIVVFALGIACGCGSPEDTSETTIDANTVAYFTKGDSEIKVVYRNFGDLGNVVGIFKNDRFYNNQHDRVAGNEFRITSELPFWGVMQENDQLLIKYDSSWDFNRSEKIN